jgi:hypothetical protein
MADNVHRKSQHAINQWRHPGRRVSMDARACPMLPGVPGHSRMMLAGSMATWRVHVVSSMAPDCATPPHLYGPSDVQPYDLCDTLSLSLARRA